MSDLFAVYAWVLVIGLCYGGPIWLVLWMLSKWINRNNPKEPVQKTPERSEKEILDDLASYRREMKDAQERREDMIAHLCAAHRRELGREDK